MRTLASRFILSLVALVALAVAPALGAPRSADAADADEQLSCLGLTNSILSYCRSHELADDLYFQQVCRLHATIVYCICAGIDCRADEEPLDPGTDAQPDSVA